MKQKLFYSIFIVAFLFFSLFFFWYGYKNYVPKKVTEVGKTFITNESIRHILKVSILNEKALKLYLLSLKNQDEDLLYDSLDFFEASLGFLQTYELSEKKVSLIRKNVYEIVTLIDKYGLTINNEKLSLILKNTNEINLVVEEIEKIKWNKLHSQIVIDETNKFQTIVILSYLIIFSLILIFVILYVSNKKAILEREKEENYRLLLNQSKVASIGEMLGNIAHQWRQPLSVITTLVSGLKFSQEIKGEVKKDEIVACVDSVLIQAQYLSKTIDDFRNFFMSNSENIENLNLAKTYLKLEDLTSSLFKSNFIQRVDDIDSTIYLNTNESLLIQALINICNNTKDVFIDKNIDTSDRYLFTKIRKESNFVFIELTDSGGGIKKGLENKIFEPYFTTKHQSIGTGIGLYMSEQIISKHLKGKISVVNEEYVYNNKKYIGAKFIIEIPLDNKIKNI